MISRKSLAVMFGFVITVCASLVDAQPARDSGAPAPGDLRGAKSLWGIRKFTIDALKVVNPDNEAILDQATLTGKLTSSLKANYVPTDATTGDAAIKVVVSLAKITGSKQSYHFQVGMSVRQDVVPFRNWDPKKNLDPLKVPAYTWRTESSGFILHDLIPDHVSKLVENSSQKLAVDWLSVNQSK